MASFLGLMSVWAGSSLCSRVGAVAPLLCLSLPTFSSRPNSKVTSSMKLPTLSTVLLLGFHSQ